MENSAFEQYLSAVCDFFPIHRLRKRIYRELSAHMEDMLEDFSAQGMESQTACEAVLTEMGDPLELRRELLQAYRPTVWRIRLQRLALAVFLYVFTLYILVPIGDELRTYGYSAPLSEAEAQLTEACAEFGEIEFIKETEYSGRLYRYYVPKQQEKDCNRVFCMESVRVFGRELQNRFIFSGTQKSDGAFFTDDLYFSYCARRGTSANTLLFDWYGAEPTEKAMVLIFTEPTDVRYFQAQLFPTDAYGEAQWDTSPCGETPYYGIEAAPKLTVVTYPADTRLGEMRFLDADKNTAEVPHSMWNSSSNSVF